MNKKRLLIIFVKNPELGKCKTRLAATIGDEKALNFYKSMLERTKHFTTKVEADKAIYYSSFIDENDLWPNEAPFYKKLQDQNPDLGMKMQSAIQDSFKGGYESVCIVGSDCYALDEKVVEQAFKSLQSNDVVLGPSNDGGYYLLGMNRLHPEFFYNKEWSTETVAPETIKDFKDLGLKFSLLEELTDIDNEDDLKTIPDQDVSTLLK